MKLAATSMKNVSRFILRRKQDVQLGPMTLRQRKPFDTFL
jgi:hypothetical protein